MGREVWAGVWKGRCCGRRSGAPLGDSSEGETERLSWKYVHPGGSKGWGKRKDGGHGERLTDSLEGRSG